MIALVISIIVMLILAGVSISAIVGEDGVITKAQTAKQAAGIAQLQEYVQQLYVQNYEEYEEYEDEKDTIFRNMYSEMFYSPYLDDNIGFKNYVIYTTTDDSGNIVNYKLYLFKKSGLPNEIKDNLVGGDAAGGGYANYSSLIDVYGITSDLNVFYCENGLDTMNTFNGKVAFAQESQETVLYGAGNGSSMYNEIIEELGLDSSDDITLGDINSVKELTINRNMSLKDLYNLSNLEILTIEDTNLTDLSGIENANKLRQVNFYNSTVGNYSALNKLENKLTRLDIYCIDDTELTKMFTDMSTGNYSKLKYLAVSGSKLYLYSTNTNSHSGKSAKTITNTDMFNLLSPATKSAINYLSLQCNNIQSLNGLIDYNNVITIRLNHNKITSLMGMDNMTMLTDLKAYDNLLGQNENNSTKNESLDSLSILPKLTSLKNIDIRSNKIIWIDYINRSTKYSGLYISSISTFNLTSVALIATTYYNANDAWIDSNYLQYLNTAEFISYANKNLTDTSSEILYLKNLSIEEKRKVKTLNLSGNSSLSNNTINDLLKDFTGLIGLDVSGITNLTTINFVSNMKKLEQIYLNDTSATDLSLLENITTIRAIKINNTSIDLTKIQATISRTMQAGYSASKYYTKGQNTGTGCEIINQNLYNKLSECTNLTYFYDGFCSKTDSLDLSKLSGTITYNLTGSNTSYTLPNSVNYIYLSNIKKLNNSSITINKLYLHTNGTWCNQLLTNLKSNTTVTINYLILVVCDGGNITEALNKVSECNIKQLAITHCSHQGTGIYIDNVENTLGQFTGLTDLSLTWVDINTIKGVDRMTNLKNLTVQETRIHDLTPLSGLTNLTSLVLNDNMISKLVGLENLKSLQTINLNNNSLVDTYVKKNESGENVNYRNIDILINLHPNNGGSLKCINISGNTSLSNIDDLKALSWSSGLTY